MNNPILTFKRGKIQDIPQVAELLYITYNHASKIEIEKKEYIRAKSIELLDLINAKILEQWVGLLNNEIVCAASLIYYEKSVWFKGMVVLPKYQARGVGSNFIGFLLKEIESKHYHTIQLFASKEGKPLYQKFQFISSYSASLIFINHIQSQDTLSQNIYVTDNCPEWIIEFDQQTTGDNRENLFRYLETIPVKFIFITQKGFVVLNDDKIGMLQAINQEIAFQLLLEVYLLGGRRMIVIGLENFGSKFSSSLDFTVYENIQSIKMNLGNELSTKPLRLFSIQSFGTG